MNPGPLVSATAAERASELARTAAARRAAVRRRTRKGPGPFLALRGLSPSPLTPARPGC